MWELGFKKGYEMTLATLLFQTMAGRSCDFGKGFQLIEDVRVDEDSSIVVYSLDGYSRTLQGINFDVQWQSGEGAFSGLQFQFPSPLNTWTVNHNLGYYPQVFLYTSGGFEFDGEVHHVSSNQFQALFNQPVAGTVKAV